MKTLLCFMIATVVFVSCKSKNEEKNRTAANDTTVINIDTFSVADPDLKRVGNLTIDMSDTALIGFLGQPNSKSAAEEWGADGLFHQDWKYPQRGVELNLSSETKDMKKAKVFSITLTEGAPFFSDRKIGIGSSNEDVNKSYSKWIDRESSDSATITVGSVYGGMIFNFTNGKVTRVFVGAAAE